MIVKSRRRLKRWIPGYGADFDDVFIKTPLLLMLSMLLITGLDFLYGVDGGEIHTLPIPKVPIAGYLLVYLAITPYLPPAIKWSIKRRANILIRRVIRAIKQRVTSSG